MKVLVIGAGGHAKVVVDAIECAGHEVAAVIDERGCATELLGYPVLAPEDAPSADGFVVAVGDNAARKARFEHYRAVGLAPVAIVHPSAVVAASVEVGAGSVVFAGAVVNRDARIGENAVLNTGCTVDHDCVVGAHAHIAPGANLCGTVIVGEGALVGVGASVLPGTTIGAWATVGAGAAVTATVPDRVTVAGVPAKELPSR